MTQMLKSVRKTCAVTILLAVLSLCLSCYNQMNQTGSQSIQGDIANLLIDPPEHGYVTNLPATKWEESMITGNGTIGALVTGHPVKERIIISHEKLFMPENPPTKAPDLGGNLDAIREFVLNGEGAKASELSLQLGEEVGIDGMIWTDPLIPACQMEIEPLDKEPVTNYSRSVNYETGEATTAWTTKHGIFKRTIFASRADGILVLRINSQDGVPSSFRIRLAQLPVEEGESNDEEQEFLSGDLIEHVSSPILESGVLKYTTDFRKKWEGSLKGYTVETRVSGCDGGMRTDGDWLYLEGCTDVLLTTGI
ncbi:MAG: glycoside hydrolase N-terminal domain-containing protein, partial [Bacteroidales bacterium]|nr:glycoside hydrolase N-terminal domain-containing protein [Bacteroidales bacterium]